MRVNELIIKNVGLIEDCIIPFDKPLLVFYGDIQQGKTTILNAVRWCFGGEYPADIIRHGAMEASVTMRLDVGSIERSWYIAKDDTTKARPISFIKDGLLVNKPVEALQKFLNPFLLDQEFLKNKSELERKKFFIELFGLNTPDLDAENTKLEQAASTLRSKIAGYGDIVVQPVEPVNIEHLRHALQNAKENHAVVIQQRHGELAKLRSDYAAASADIAAKNAEVAQLNGAVQRAEQDGIYLKNTIANLEAQLVKAKEDLAANLKWVEEHPKQNLLSYPPVPDTAALEASLSELPNTAEIDAKLAEGLANNVRYENYLKEKNRLEEKETAVDLLRKTEQRQREIKQTKIDRLSALAAASGIPGLAFNDDATFSFEGVSAGMLSTSQVMRLSSLLSARYPAGLGVELIDRAESLGKSIFEFVSRAVSEQKTILATVVGERPANAPEQVGVFVVEKGKVC
jgi:hypothetical protein